jgi:Fur family peroxide stress response transcriptional regulator
MLTQKEINGRIDHFKEVCRNNGVKLTYQRLVIFEDVASSEEHPDAETIFRKVRKIIPTISLDTIYRTLWLLNDLGLVNTVRSIGSSIRFDANTEPHHHFVCIKCGMTHDFRCDRFNKLKIPDEVGKIGDVKATHVELRGLCSRCSKHNKSTIKKGNNSTGRKT